MPLSFGGSQIRRPGAYSVVDTSGMIPLQIGALKTLGFVGKVGTGGTLSPASTESVTGGVYFFNSPKLAKEALGNGETIDHMNKAWAHGADLVAVAIVEQTYNTTNSALDEPTQTQWEDAIARFETESIAGVVPVTTDSAVHVAVDAHCTTMSTVNARMERRAFYGHASGMAKADILALQTALNSERAMIASPAVYDYDDTGAKVLKPSSYLASAYAGIWAKQPVQVPLTYKFVKFAGLETKYNSVDIGDLLEGGIAVTEHVEGKGLRIVRAITASGSEDLTQKELSVSTLKDVMSSNLRSNLEEKFVGKAGVAGIEVDIFNAVNSMLVDFKRRGWITAFSNVQVRQDGTAFYVDWEGKPTLPINNFFITSHFTL